MMLYFNKIVNSILFTVEKEENQDQQIKIQQNIIKEFNISNSSIKPDKKDAILENDDFIKKYLENLDNITSIRPRGTISSIVRHINSELNRNSSTKAIYDALNPIKNTNSQLYSLKEFLLNAKKSSKEEDRLDNKINKKIDANTIDGDLINDIKSLFDHNAKIENITDYINSLIRNLEDKFNALKKTIADKKLDELYSETDFKHHYTLFNNNNGTSVKGIGNLIGLHNTLESSFNQLDEIMIKYITNVTKQYDSIKLKQSYLFSSSDSRFSSIISEEDINKYNKLYNEINEYNSMISKTDNTTLIGIPRLQYQAIIKSSIAEDMANKLKLFYEELFELYKGIKFFQHNIDTNHISTKISMITTEDFSSIDYVIKGFAALSKEIASKFINEKDQYEIFKNYSPDDVSIDIATYNSVLNNILDNIPSYSVTDDNIVEHALKLKIISDKFKSIEGIYKNIQSEITEKIKKLKDQFEVQKLLQSMTTIDYSKLFVELESLIKSIDNSAEKNNIVENLKNAIIKSEATDTEAIKILTEKNNALSSELSQYEHAEEYSDGIFNECNNLLKLPIAKDTLKINIENIQSASSNILEIKKRFNKRKSLLEREFKYLDKSISKYITTKISDYSKYYSDFNGAMAKKPINLIEAKQALQNIKNKIDSTIEDFKNNFITKKDLFSTATFINADDYNKLYKDCEHFLNLASLSLTYKDKLYNFKQANDIISKITNKINSIIRNSLKELENELNRYKQVIATNSIDPKDLINYNNLVTEFNDEVVKINDTTNESKIRIDALIKAYQKLQEIKSDIDPKLEKQFSLIEDQNDMYNKFNSELKKYDGINDKSIAQYTNLERKILDFYNIKDTRQSLDKFKQITKEIENDFIPLNDEYIKQTNERIRKYNDNIKKIHSEIQQGDLAVIINNGLNLISYIVPNTPVDDINAAIEILEDGEIASKKYIEFCNNAKDIYDTINKINHEGITLIKDSIDKFKKFYIDTLQLSPFPAFSIKQRIKDEYEKIFAACKEIIKESISFQLNVKTLSSKLKISYDSTKHDKTISDYNSITDDMNKLSKISDICKDHIEILKTLLIVSLQTRGLNYLQNFKITFKFAKNSTYITNFNREIARIEGTIPDIKNQGELDNMKKACDDAASLMIIDLKKYFKSKFDDMSKHELQNVDLRKIHTIYINRYIDQYKKLFAQYNTMPQNSLKEMCSVDSVLHEMNEIIKNIDNYITSESKILKSKINNTSEINKFFNSLNGLHLKLKNKKIENILYSIVNVNKYANNFLNLDKSTSTIKLKIKLESIEEAMESYKKVDEQSDNLLQDYKDEFSYNKTLIGSIPVLPKTKPLLDFLNDINIKIGNILSTKKNKYEKLSELARIDLVEISEEKKDHFINAIDTTSMETFVSCNDKIIEEIIKILPHTKRPSAKNTIDNIKKSNSLVINIRNKYLRYFLKDETYYDRANSEAIKLDSIVLKIDKILNDIIYSLSNNCANIDDIKNNTYTYLNELISINNIMEWIWGNGSYLQNILKKRIKEEGKKEFSDDINKSLMKINENKNLMKNSGVYPTSSSGSPTPPPKKLTPPPKKEEVIHALDDIKKYQLINNPEEELPPLDTPPSQQPTKVAPNNEYEKIQESQNQEKQNDKIDIKNLILNSTVALSGAYIFKDTISKNIKNIASHIKKITGNKLDNKSEYNLEDGDDQSGYSTTDE